MSTHLQRQEFWGGSPAGRPLSEIKARMLPFIVIELLGSGIRVITRLWRRFADRYSANGTIANPFHAPYPLLRAFFEHYLHRLHVGKVSCYNVTKEFITPFYTAARIVDTDFTSSIGHTSPTRRGRGNETHLAEEVIRSINRQGEDWGLRQDNVAIFVDPREVIETTGQQDDWDNAAARYEKYNEDKGEWERVIIYRAAHHSNRNRIQSNTCQCPKEDSA